MYEHFCLTNHELKIETKDERQLTSDETGSRLKASQSETVKYVTSSPVTRTEASFVVHPSEEATS